MTPRKPKTPPKRSRSGTATRPNADRGPKAARMVTVTLAPDVVARLEALAPFFKGGKSAAVAEGIRLLWRHRPSVEKEIDLRDE